MPLRKLVPLIAAALALGACSADTITGPRSAPRASATPHYEEGTGMLGGGGRM
jgi:hypothetical protein